MSWNDRSHKLAGLLIPVFALREKEDLGIGDTLSVRNAIDFCASHKFGLLQLLPINETGGDNSPYNAISSVALDPVLLHMSPEHVPGLTERDLAEVAPPEVRGELAQGPVNYPRVKQKKLELLRRGFQGLRHLDGANRSQFEEFQRQHIGWLRNYTLFRALLDEHNGDPRWPLWAPEWKSVESAEGSLALNPRGLGIRDKRQFYAYVQWIAYRQWGQVKAYATSHNVLLMGDIPFGVSRYGADVWADRSLFDLTWSGGAPPEKHFKTDPFTEKWGQNWGIPLYDWTAHENQHFSWWRQRVERTCEVFHSFRIDHVLGFFRVYSFPWIPERNEEFVHLDETSAKILAGGRLPMFIPRPDELEEDAQLNAAEGKRLLKIIQAAAGDSIVVAEDLGMVPDYVRPLLQELGIPGFTIPPFDRDEEDRSYIPPSEFPEINLITYATHDHPPLAQFYEDLVSWWTGPDGHEGWLEICRLMEFLGLEGDDAPRSFTPELHHDLIAAILETRCWLAVLMITDLFGTKQRFNEPGSTGASNWSERLEGSLESYSSNPTTQEILANVSEEIVQSGRAP